jgi:hypothetical protein
MTEIPIEERSKMSVVARAADLVDRYNRYGGCDDVGMMVAFYQEALERAARILERAAAEIRALKEEE